MAWCIGFADLHWTAADLADIPWPAAGSDAYFLPSLLTLPNLPPPPVMVTTMKTMNTTVTVTALTKLMPLPSLTY